MDNPPKVEDLLISERVKEILKKKKIKTVGQLVFSDFHKLKGIGPKAIEEIVEAIRRFGVRVDLKKLIEESKKKG
jgi:DNA-directed RNA polymerase alpha subunit